MSAIGPVQLVAVGFGPDANFEGEIIAELVRLERTGTVRLLDLLFVRKEDDGDLVALDIQGEDLGAIVGALLGFEFEGDGDGPSEDGAVAGHGTEAFGLGQAQIEGIGASLEPGHAAGVMLIEHVWARDLKAAVRNAGGVPIAEGFLTPETLALVAAEVVAMAEALDEEHEAQGASTGS
jgi:hypothetical protein